MLKSVAQLQMRLPCRWYILLCIAGLLVMAIADRPAWGQNPEQATERSPTTITVVSSANPAPMGQSVTFTASVKAAGGAPTGAVTFKDGADFLGAVRLSADGKARLPVSTLASGPHIITARYDGDSRFAPSESAPYEQTLESESSSRQSLWIMLATIAAVALLVLSRRIVSPEWGGSPGGCPTIRGGRGCSPRPMK